MVRLTPGLSRHDAGAVRPRYLNPFGAPAGAEAEVGHRFHLAQVSASAANALHPHAAGRLRPHHRTASRSAEPRQRAHPQPVVRRRPARFVHAERLRPAFAARDQQFQNAVAVDVADRRTGAETVGVERIAGIEHRRRAEIRGGSPPRRSPKTRNSRFGSPRLLKNSSSWPSLSKSAAITVRTADGNANPGVARSFQVPFSRQSSAGAVLPSSPSTGRTRRSPRVERRDAAAVFFGVASPFSAAHSANVPSPRFRNAKFGPCSFTQMMSGWSREDRQRENAAAAGGEGESQRRGEVRERTVGAEFVKPHRPAVIRDEEPVAAHAAAVDYRDAPAGGQVAEVWFSGRAKEVFPAPVGWDRTSDRRLASGRRTCRY